MTYEDIEVDEPLIRDAGWRRFVDIDEARAEGLTPPTRVRGGGSRAEMWHNLDRVIAPLVEAGWRSIYESSEGRMGRSRLEGADP